MGSKKALLIVLGLILLSSSVCAVDFEWALGDSRTQSPDTLSASSGEVSGTYFEQTKTPDLIGDKRMIVTKMSATMQSSSGGCGAYFSGTTSYVARDNKNAEMTNFVQAQHVDNTFLYFYRLANSVQYLCDSHECFAWCGVGGLVGCCNRCYYNCKLETDYVSISASDVDSVFKEDRVKSVGSIYELLGDKLPPTGETVYLGIDDSDVMYWIGKEGEEYNSQKEITDPAADDYLNVCADVDRDGECDYKQAEKCENAGADWYKDVCCGENPGAIEAATGLKAVNCSYQPNTFGKDLYAFCGKTLDGKWKWAPLNDDYGNIHEMLACPGFSFVSNKNNLYGCKGSSVQGITDTVVEGTPYRNLKTSAPLSDSDRNYIPMTGLVNISGTLGAHEYICSNGEIFECKGDTASYTGNQDFVAETGITTFELLGSGGCPPLMISYWTFNNGTAKDTKGSFNGNIIGAVATAGKIYNALAFDGGDRVEVSGNLVAGNSFTFEAWIKPTEISGYRKIAEKAGTFRVAISDGVLVGAVNTGAGLVDFGSRTLVSGIWHHVALIYDGNEAKLYLNGIAVEEEMTGNVSWSSQPLIFGGNFIGDIDDAAIYGKALRSSLMALHTKNPAAYCKSDSGVPVVNNYCAADGDWTPDLDIKDISSCNKAGFHWTGSKCCSEADDVPTEYYNEQDIPAPDLMQAVVASHAGAQVSSAQVILSNVGHYATISGPARLSIESYSAESASEIGSCPKIDTSVIDVAPWENKTIRIEFLGDTGDPCKYRWKIITVHSILALGGCWNKTFVPRGSLVSQKILNHQGAFFGCALPTGSPFFSIKDTFTNSNLITNLQPTCSGIKLNAAGPGNHSVCGPGGIWLYTNNSAATFVKNISWDPADYGIAVLSESGCCGDDQCWDGFGCVDAGTYYTINGDAFICRN